MTFERHRSLLPDVPYATSAAYHLSGTQSAAWHASDREGEVVRAEIRAAAARRRVPIYDVDGERLDGPTSPAV